VKNGARVYTGLFRGKLVLRRAPYKGRPLIKLLLTADSAVEMHTEECAGAGKGYSASTVDWGDVLGVCKCNCLFAAGP
jgi:hypothetical protein